MSNEKDKKGKESWTETKEDKLLHLYRLMVPNRKPYEFLRVHLEHGNPYIPFALNYKIF